MTDSTHAPKAPAPSRRGLILSAVLGVAVLGAIALDTTVVRVGSEADARQQAFSPDTYGTEEFPRIRDAVIERAVPAADLAAAIAADQDAAIAEYGTPASTGAIMMVTLTGTAGEPRAGVYPLTVEGLPEDLRVVWVLREVGGHSYDEIAVEVGETPATVRGRLARARKTVLERMQEWR